MGSGGFKIRRRVQESRELEFVTWVQKAQRI